MTKMQPDKIISTDAAEKVLIDAALAKADKYEFVNNFMYTHDEHDKSIRYKKFPRNKLVHRIVIRAYNDYDVLFIEKSRQQRMTWLFAGIMLHETLFYQNRRTCFQSTKDEYAEKLVARAQFIYEGLEYVRFPGLPIAKMTASEIKIRENNSVISAVPQGGEVFSSLTFSNVLADEISKQAKAEEGYTDAMPTVQSGGKYVGIFTPNGKEFGYKKMHGVDRQNRKRGIRIVDSTRIYNLRYTEQQLIDMDQEEFDSIPFEMICACVPGIEFWIMKLDEEITPCLHIHYSSDPDKRPGTEAGDAWYARERPKYSAERWAREMEISYDTFEGRPVVSNWEEKTFVRHVEYDRNSILRIPVDFGTEVCCAGFMQKMKLANYDFYYPIILADIELRGSNTIVLADSIIELLQIFFPHAWESGNFVAHPDPAGFQKSSVVSDKSLDSDIKILRSKGIPCVSQKFPISSSTRLVETLFSRVSPVGDPGVLVHPRCHYLLRCLRGGWHYPDKPVGQSDGKPEKDGEFDHGGDVIRYGFSNMFDASEFGGAEQITFSPSVPIRQKYTGKIIGHKPNPRYRGSIGRGGHRVHS